MATPSPPSSLTEEHTSLLSRTIPASALTTLLESRTPARSPKKPRITDVSSTHLTITYEQPVREYWYHAMTQRAVIAMRGLPAVGEKGWDRKVLAVVEDGRPVAVSTVVWPSSWVELVGVLVFLGFTTAIMAWIAGARWWWLVKVFKTEKRFNVAVMVHAVVLVKRSGDVRKMGQMLGVHWRGGAAGRWAWTVCCWVEGWRAVARFMKEIERATVEEEKRDGESKKVK